MSATTDTDALRAGDSEVLHLVLGSGTAGMSRAAIAGRTDRPEGGISIVLRRLRDLGLVEATNPAGGKSCRWGAPGTTARYAQTLSARDRERNEARSRAARAEADRARAAWREPVRYASVWEYAAMGGAA